MLFLGPTEAPPVKHFVSLLTMMDEMDGDMAWRAKSLRGPKTKGPITSFDLEDIQDLDCKVSLLKDVCPEAVAIIPEGCHAFVVSIPSYFFLNHEIKLVEVPLKDCLSAHPELTDGDVTCVSTREGAGGPELFTRLKVGRWKPKSSEYLTVLTGPACGKKEVLKYWFPGLPLVPFDGNRLTPMTAVKINNG